MEVRGVETRHGQPTVDQQGRCGPGNDTAQESESAGCDDQLSEEKKELNWTKTNEILALLAVAFTNDFG